MWTFGADLDNVWSRSCYPNHVVTVLADVRASLQVDSCFACKLACCMLLASCMLYCLQAGKLPFFRLTTSFAVSIR
jgi:hypothetical protein